jgi:thiol-disulfide isomerase/thioredoxin
VYSWASWCPYCEQGFKDLTAIQGEYGSAIHIVAINRAEPKGDAQQFTDRLPLSPGITYLLDQNDTFYKAIGGFAMPEILFINWHGDIVAHQRGPMTFDALRAEVQSLLK